MWTTLSIFDALGEYIYADWSYLPVVTSVLTTVPEILSTARKKGRSDDTSYKTNPAKKSPIHRFTKFRKIQFCL